MKEWGVGERAEKEEEERAESPDRARIENHLAQRHCDNEHGHQRGYAEQVQAPGRVEPEEFKIARLKVEQEMITNPVT